MYNFIQLFINGIHLAMERIDGKATVHLFLSDKSQFIKHVDKFIVHCAAYEIVSGHARCCRFI